MEEINRSEIVIALITEAAFTSKYIPDEIKAAINKQKYVIPCVRNNVDLANLGKLGLKKEQVIIFDDDRMDKLYGKINDAIASYKKNPDKVKEYYKKRKKEKRKKIVISSITGSAIVVILVLFILQLQLNIESKYVYSWGSLDTSNLEFHSPIGIAVDSEVNLYVADTGNNRIQKIHPDGNITSIGKYGSVLGQFSSPRGVAVDNKGNLYVADSGNNRIQKFDASGKFKVIGKKDQFSSPSGVAVDSEDNLYVADTGNNRIQKIHPDGNVSIIGSFNLSEKIGSSNFGPREFSSPIGVTVDNKGNLYVADTDNNRIQIFDKSSDFIGVVGKYGSVLGQFSSPRGVAVDNKGNLYVADSGNNRIQKISSSTILQLDSQKLNSTIWKFEYKN